MWDERYSEEGFAYGTEPNEFLRAQSQKIPPGRVLCLAAGEGRNAVYLAQRGYQVDAVDASRVGMDKTAQLAEARGVNVETTVADLATFAIAPATYSGIVSIFCHVPVAIRRPIHRAAVSGLLPGGRFIFEAYSKEQLGRGTGGPPNEALLASLPDVLSELDGLTILHATTIERPIIEGRYHSGLASVVQVVAEAPPP